MRRLNSQVGNGTIGRDTQFKHQGRTLAIRLQRHGTVGQHLGHHGQGQAGQIGGAQTPPGGQIEQRAGRDKERGIGDSHR